MQRASLPPEMLDDASTTMSAPTEGARQRAAIVIMPTYNEAQNIVSMVARIMELGAYDVLVVDDHSPDGTGQLADALAVTYLPHVTVLHRTGKQGLGTAYREGFQYALAHNYRFIFMMDADGSHDVAALPELHAALGEADVAIGSRFVPGGASRHWPFWRQWLSRSGSTYARLLLNLPMRDVTGGFRGFRRQALAAVLDEPTALHARGYAMQIELNYRCAQQHLQIVEIPIVFANRQAGQTKLDVGIITEALWYVWFLRWPSAAASTDKEQTTAAPRPRWLPLALLGLVLGLGAIAAIPFVRSMGGPVTVRPHPAAATGGSSGQTVELTHAAEVQIRDPDLMAAAPLAFLGGNFLPGEALTASIATPNGQAEGQFEPLQADADGHVSAVEPLANLNLAPGSYELIIRGMHSQRLAHVTFRVHWLLPTVELATYYAKPGATVTFAGRGFVPREAVRVTLQGTASAAPTVLATTQADADGRALGQWTTPASAEGPYTVTFMGAQSQSPVMVTFTIHTYHPWVVLDNYAPTPRTKLGLNGHDFAPGETVLVYLNERGGTPLLQARADPDGGVALPAGWTVTDLAGPQTLIMVGQQSGASASVDFTVQPAPGG